MNFSLGCSLVYRVKSPTPFVFNFEAARFDVQTVREERLELIPKTSIERWTMPESGNRYLRILAEPGEFRVRYEAKVELSPRLEDPDAITEISAGQLLSRCSRTFIQAATASPISWCGLPAARSAICRPAIIVSTASATGFATTSIMPSVRLTC